MSKELYDAILAGNMKGAIAATEKALADKVDPLELVQKYMVPAMDEVGRRFECEEYFVPEMLISARAMKSSLMLVKPLLTASGAQPAGRVIIATVKGDLHDIGKNIVASMLEGAGFEVFDLGADVAPDKFVTAVKEKSPHLVCLSALLTVTMPSMKTTIDALQQAGIRQQVKVLIGGAPITQHFADQIGADGYGENAASAVTLARKLMHAERSAQ
jgi:5-methyltetrahydrofolate--homocysteine methyltransferase